ncbi:MAG TPA: hypothetical protein VFC81_00665 [Verrucomicrobiae bacterium]|nr:hypothetical protein [Verrucomicrobiae bacterium]
MTSLSAKASWPDGTGMIDAAGAVLAEALGATLAGALGATDDGARLAAAGDGVAAADVQADRVMANVATATPAVRNERMPDLLHESTELRRASASPDRDSSPRREGLQRSTPSMGRDNVRVGISWR